MISVSYLGVDFESTIKKLNETSCDFIHCDVMDGIYVPNKTMDFYEFRKISKLTKKKLDVHLMVADPVEYIDLYSKVSPEYITVHLDTNMNTMKLINYIKTKHVKVGLAINPNQDLELIKPYLKYIDLVLVMTVVPGLPGQKLIESVIPKLNELRKIIDDNHYNILINVDGGVNIDTKDLVKNSDILVSGSFVTKKDNFEEAINILRN